MNSPMRGVYSKRKRNVESSVDVDYDKINKFISSGLNAITKFKVNKPTTLCVCAYQRRFTHISAKLILKFMLIIN